jgi:hypothetical protein
VRAVRRIWPPPSPRDPSSSILDLGFWIGDWGLGISDETATLQSKIGMRVVFQSRRSRFWFGVSRKRTAVQFKIQNQGVGSFAAGGRGALGSAGFVVGWTGG